MNEKEPVHCSYCLAQMVRTHYQTEEGDWFICWLCECSPDYNLINTFEKAIQEAENILHKETNI